MVLLGAYGLNAIFNLAIGLLVARFLGPAEFGRFALALAFAAVAQLLVFDWLRLSALRFAPASESSGGAAASLNLAFAVLAGAGGALALILWVADVESPLAAPLLALSLGCAVANGLFDFRCARMRACFDDAAYARLMLAKNILGVALTVGAAVVTHSAQATLAGACIAMAAPAFLVRRKTARTLFSLSQLDMPLLRRSLAYSAPIVLAAALYAAIPLLNRAVIANSAGYAEAGYFALAHDVGSRLLAAIGAGLDVLLFQMAVRADDEKGRAAARAQVARNGVLIVSILAAAALGCWLVAPSLEAVFAPPEYHGPFAAHLERLAPGLFCQAVALFALSAIYQIERRTVPLLLAALLGLAVNAGLLAIVSSADPGFVAAAQSAAFAASALALLAFARFVGAQAPPARDVAGAALALAAMFAATHPLRAFDPGVMTLALQTTVGALVFGACALVFNLAGVRAALAARIQRG